MRTTLAVWLLSGALLGSAGLNAYYAGRGAPAGPPCGGGDGVLVSESRPACRMVEELCLTEGQRQKLYGCCGGTCARERNERGQRLRLLVDELERALNAATVERTQVDRLADEIAALRAQEWKFRIQCILQVRETLTRDQLARLAATVQGP